jgi:membrane carboxypeptidase/penicillin-binding protein PbpC
MLLTGLAAFMLDRLDRAFPPPLEQAADVSRQVVDRNGRLLRAYTTKAASGGFRCRSMMWIPTTSRC